MQAYGFYYDGLSSHRVQVEAYLVSGFLMIRGSGVDIKLPLASVTVEEAIGSGRSVIRFADGGMFAFDDALFSDLVVAAHGKRTKLSIVVNRWEKSFFWSVTALLVVAAIVFAVVRYGVPALSHRVAFLVSPDIEKRLGEESLAALDKFVFKPSGLPEDSVERLRLVFHDVARETSIGDNARILFRKGGMLGANAVAIPSGIVVMTDELVLLAKDDWEIAAVMAHEAGHARERHGLRHLLQNSMTALVVSSAIGDVASISSLAASVPTLLINAKYSRDFEREADAAAARYLQSRDISVQKFADILERLEENHTRRSKDGSSQREADKGEVGLSWFEEKRTRFEAERARLALKLTDLEMRRYELNMDRKRLEADHKQKGGEFSRSGKADYEYSRRKVKLDWIQDELKRSHREIEQVRLELEQVQVKLEQQEADHKGKGKDDSSQQEADHKQKGGGRASGFESYISSHPPVRERIEQLSTFRRDGS